MDSPKDILTPACGVCGGRVILLPLSRGFGTLDGNGNAAVVKHYTAALYHAPDYRENYCGPVCAGKRL